MAGKEGIPIGMPMPCETYISEEMPAGMNIRGVMTGGSEIEFAALRL
jgi:hypothetical protein